MLKSKTRTEGEISSERKTNKYRGTDKFRNQDTDKVAEKIRG